VSFNLALRRQCFLELSLQYDIHNLIKHFLHVDVFVFVLFVLFDAS
jgi:hypothetical protein